MRLIFHKEILQFITLRMYLYNVLWYDYNRVEEMRGNEVYVTMDKINDCKCNKCNRWFSYKDQDTFWDESGYGYSTKLVKCPYCGAYHVIKYVEDRWLKKYAKDVVV